mmetsp:Transcript_3177/g.6570  ORF Transcript_3177/g.6570 Transcript_3177/m.6570 type:complete len:238 (+) Transcript_3177:397-1110(+)
MVAGWWYYWWRYLDPHLRSCEIWVQMVVLLGEASVPDRPKGPRRVVLRAAVSVPDRLWAATSDDVWAAGLLEEAPSPSPAGFSSSPAGFSPAVPCPRRSSSLSRSARPPGSATGGPTAATGGWRGSARAPASSRDAALPNVRSSAAAAPRVCPAVPAPRSTTPAAVWRVPDWCAGGAHAAAPGNSSGGAVPPRSGWEGCPLLRRGGVSCPDSYPLFLPPLRWAARAGGRRDGPSRRR